MVIAKTSLCPTMEKDIKYCSNEAKMLAKNANKRPNIFRPSKYKVNTVTTERKIMKD